MHKRQLTLTLILCLIIILAPLNSANAHFIGTNGYSQITINQNTINYVLLLDLDQLLMYLPIDNNGNGKIDDAEAEQVQLIKEFIMDHLEVKANDYDGEFSFLDLKVAEQDEKMVQFDFIYTFNKPIKTYHINYSLYYKGFDMKHKNFATIKSGNQTIEKILSVKKNIIKGERKEVISTEPTNTSSTNKQENPYIFLVFITLLILLSLIFIILLIYIKKKK